MTTFVEEHFTPIKYKLSPVIPLVITVSPQQIVSTTFKFRGFSVKKAVYSAGGIVSPVDFGYTIQAGINKQPLFNIFIGDTYIYYYDLQTLQIGNAVNGGGSGDTITYYVNVFDGLYMAR